MTIRSRLEKKQNIIFQVQALRR